MVFNRWPNTGIPHFRGISTQYSPDKYRQNPEPQKRLWGSAHTFTGTFPGFVFGGIFLAKFRRKSPIKGGFPIYHIYDITNFGQQRPPVATV